MGTETHIQWCDHTFNPWEGCTKVSAGCKHCYAETRNQRFAAGANWGKGAPRRRTSEANWKQPLAWNRTAICACGGSELIGSDDCRHCGKNFDPATRRRHRVFCASLADWLDDEVPIEWLMDLLRLIQDTPNLDWLLLTKRPEHWRPRLVEVLNLIPRCGITSGDAMLRARIEIMLNGWSGYTYTAPEVGRENYWIGTSVEDQAAADLRIPQLLQLPARVRFLSCEPLLGPVDLAHLGSASPTAYPFMDCLRGKEAPGSYLRDAKVHWVIVGGESGSADKCRPCDVTWIESIVKQCQSANVACFVKQLGSFVTTPNANLHDWPDEVDFREHGEGFAAGRAVLAHPKGGDPAEWPVDLQVRQFPAP